MSKINFLHIRNINRDGQIDGRGGATVAYAENVQEGTITWAVARCSPGDNFNKAYGRAKAAGRLNSSSHRKVCVGGVGSFREQMFTAFAE